jgi:hypothetical protein
VNWLAQLGNLLRSVQGRKQIVYLSEGFDARFISGREARESEDHLAETDAVATGRVWEVNSEARFGDATQLTNLARMQKAFRGSDVTLNAIDIRGIRGGAEESGAGDKMAMSARNDGLFLLARSTGGMVFQNSNDLSDDFARLLKREEVIYVLGFQAPVGTKPNAFHPLQVKVTGVSRATVSSRTGYYDLPELDFNSRLLSTAEIITNDIPQHDIPVTTLAAAFPAADGSFQVPVIVDIDGAALLRASKNAGRAEIYVYAFAEDGGVRDQLFQNVELDLKKVGDRARAGGLRYYGTLSLPPGRYAVKALVRGGDDRKGFSRVDVNVPKPGEVAAQLVPIDEEPRAILIKGKARGEEQPYPFQLSGQTYVPCTVAQSKIALYIPGSQPDEISVETRAKVLGKTTTPNGSVVLLEVERGTNPTLDVTVRSKGSEVRTASVAVGQK